MLEVINRSSIQTINLDLDYNPEVRNEDAETYAENIGKYPYVVIDGLVVESKNIVDFRLLNDKFLPRLEMEFKDPTLHLMDRIFPLDDSRVSVYIRPQSDTLFFIRMDFKILNFTPKKTREGDFGSPTITLKGIIDVDRLYYTEFVSYKGASLDVLKKVAEECQLGFVTNVEVTRDEMTWVNPSDTYHEFLQEIVAKSYVDDNSFLWSYIDFSYNLVFVNIDKQVRESGKGKSGLVTNYFDGKDKGNEAKNLARLVLTDHPDKMGVSGCYISKYTLSNDSLEVNLALGYRGKTAYYSRTDQVLSKIEIDSISDTGGDANRIVLKGAPGNNEGIYKYNWGIKPKDKIDLDNVHENYPYAEDLNQCNIEYVQKVKLKLIMQTPNFNLYRFETVTVELYSKGQLDAETSLPPTTPQEAPGVDRYKLNKRLSGDWLIVGINYVFDRKTGIAQEVNLVRRELSSDGS